MTSLALAGLFAYLIGSIPFAILVSRAFNLPDPRSYGSGNPGATNVLRSGKKAAAIVTLLGDTGKGYVAVRIAQAYAESDQLITVAAALAVFLGHLFPVFLRFKGGKGVATAGGALLALYFWLGIGAIAAWLIGMLVFRVSAAAAVCAAVIAPLFAFGLFGFHLYSLATLMMAVLLIWRHRSNIEQLASKRKSADQL